MILFKLFSNYKFTRVSFLIDSLTCMLFDWQLDLYALWLTAWPVCFLIDSLTCMLFDWQLDLHAFWLTAWPVCFLIDSLTCMLFDWQLDLYAFVYPCWLTAWYKSKLKSNSRIHCINIIAYHCTLSYVSFICHFLESS